MRRAKQRIADLPPVVGFVCLYVVAVVVYVWLGSKKAQPEIFADELIYGNLAQSIALGDGLSWRGATTGLSTLLYPLIIAPGWLAQDGVTAYHFVKLINAVVMCLAAVPIWLLARRFVSPRLALTVAALTVAGAWMESVGKVMTENLAFPLGTAAVCATVMACWAGQAADQQTAESGPTERSPQFWVWAALAFGGMAAFARLQLVVLPAVTVIALVIDLLRQPSQLRAELWQQRKLPLLAACGAIAITLTAVSIDQSLLGRFTAVADFEPDLGHWVEWTFLQTAGLVVMSGIVPIVVTVAVVLRPTSWSDRDLGPLLSVATPLVVLLAAMSGWFVAGNQGAAWLVERYMIYALPLLILVCVAAVGKLERRTSIAAVAVVALTTIASPAVVVKSEAKSFLSLTERLDTIDGPLNASPSLLRFALTIAIGTGAIYWLDKRKVWPVVVMIAVVLGSASTWTWSFDTAYAKQAKALNYTPNDWVGQATDGPVAMLFSGASNSVLPMWLEFFSPTVKRAYALPGAAVPADGAMCQLSIGADGSLVPPPNCPPPMRQFVIFGDGRSTVSMRGGRVLVDHGLAGQLIATTEDPRLLATVGTVPCDPAAPTGCSGQVIVNAWLDRDAVLTVHLRGAAQSQKLEVGQRTYRLDPGKITAVRIPMASGFQSITLPTDWSQPAASSPALTRATVDEGSGPVEIFTD